MPKYTKYLEFSQKERTAIRERDNYRCISGCVLSGFPG